MEMMNVSNTAILGAFVSVLLSVCVPVILLFVWHKKYHAKISTFFIGAGTFILFAMVLEQILHVLVIQVAGLNEQDNRWLYCLYGAAAAAVFEETGRLVAMKCWMKKRLDFSNAFMYGIGHGGIEAIIIGGLTGFSNLLTMLMINSGAIEHSLAVLSDEMRAQTMEQLSALWTTPPATFFVGGIERMSALVLQIALSLLIFKAVQSKKWGTAVLAYLIHFAVDFVAVAAKNDLPLWLLEAFICVAAIGTMIFAWRTKGTIAVCDENEIAIDTLKNAE